MNSFCVTLRKPHTTAEKPRLATGGRCLCYNGQYRQLAY
jgi:hypothetical protein